MLMSPEKTKDNNDHNDSIKSPFLCKGDCLEPLEDTGIHAMIIQRVLSEGVQLCHFLFYVDQECHLKRAIIGYVMAFR